MARFTEEERVEVWDRWEAGESQRSDQPGRGEVTVNDPHPVGVVWLASVDAGCGVVTVAVVADRTRGDQPWPGGW